MADKQLEFFIYDHDERTFDYFEGDRSNLVDIMAAENPEDIAHELDSESIDGMLVLDEDGGRWYLAFADSLGIVGQRTARRQADTIVRSGHQLPDGFWLRAPDYPLEELSDPNLGDLWQSVQQKYVKTDLKGMDLDEESGIPSQLAERAKNLEKSGMKDELSEAKFEKEEAKERKKAEEKSKKKSTTKKAKPKPKVAKKSAQKPAPAKTERKKTDKSKETKEKGGPMFLDCEKVRNYVKDGTTRIMVKGQITEGTNEPEPKTVILSQDHLDSKDWTEIAVFLDDGDVVQITTEEQDDGLYATSLKV